MTYLPTPPGLPADDPTVMLASRFNSIAVHLARRLRKADQALGIGPARGSALSVLVFGGPHTIGELAAREQVTPPTMTRIVTGLEAEGLAERHADAHDRRLVRVVATARGHEVMERGRALRVQRLAGELHALPAGDRATLERAASIFERLEGALDY